MAVMVRGDAASDSRVAGSADHRGIPLDLGASLLGARQRPRLWTRLHVSGEGDGYPRSTPPWQNGYAERLIGTLRCECLDQMIIFGETHLRRILSAYAAYDNQARTHLALQKDAPLHRVVQRSGGVVAIPVLAGLHHQYVRI
jgi:integrase-like protein